MNQEQAYCNNCWHIRSLYDELDADHDDLREKLGMAQRQVDLLGAKAAGLSEALEDAHMKLASARAEIESLRSRDEAFDSLASVASLSSKVCEDARFTRDDGHMFAVVAREPWEAMCSALAKVAIGGGDER